jgi:hypothetical protein
VTPAVLAFAGTEQVRSGAIGPVGSVGAHFVFRGQGRRRDRLRRDRDLGEDYPTNVQSDGKRRNVFVRLCQAWASRCAVGFSEFRKF